MRFIQSRPIIARGIWLTLLISLPLDPLILGALTRLQGEVFTNCSRISALLLSAALILRSANLQITMLQALRTIQRATFSVSNYKPVIICVVALLILAVIEFLLSVSRATMISLVIGSWIFLAAIITIFQQLRSNRTLASQRETSRLLLVQRLAQQDLFLLLLPAFCARLASLSLAIDNQTVSGQTYLPILALAAFLLLVTYPPDDGLITCCSRCKQSRLRLFTEHGACTRCLAQESESPRAVIDQRGNTVLPSPLQTS